tara:strand:+ start:580 stop:1104 length:525 start_codon:yes stop_codon:yes gene_type:complete
MLTISTEPEHQGQRWVTVGSEVKLPHGARGLVKAVTTVPGENPGDGFVSVEVVCFGDLQEHRVEQGSLVWISMNDYQNDTHAHVDFFVELHSVFENLDKELWRIYQDNEQALALAAKVIEAHRVWRHEMRNYGDSKASWKSVQQAGRELNDWMRYRSLPQTPQTPEEGGCCPKM